MNPQTLKYLQKDEIGKVVATGLAELYLNKPSKPVKYLAMWLKNYSTHQAEMLNLLRLQKQKEQAAIVYEKQVEAMAAVENEKSKRLQKEKQSLDEFRQAIVVSQYQEDFLQEALPQFIEISMKATGTYIGELSYPHKGIKEEDTDESAHLDTTAEKIIIYVGSSVSHKQLMRGKTLKLSQGVTAGAFSLLEQGPASAVGEDGQQVLQPPKPKYVFVPNVVKNQSIHYFKIPKLGSYLAVPIICNQYLTQLNFDSVLKQRLDYLKRCEELEVTKRSELEELQKEYKDLQKKLAELSEKNADQAHLQPIRLELKQITEAMGQKQKQFVEEKQPNFIGNKKSYVICADTLGQDRAFQQSEIDQITSLASHFKESWENKEKQLLKKDVDQHIKAHQNLAPEVARQDLMHSLSLSEEEQKQVAGIGEENKKLLRQLELQVYKIRAAMKENSVFMKAFIHLSQFRVIKYKQLLQNILFFLRFKKSDINTPQRASLNWREVKKRIINEETFHKIFEYNPIGPKKQIYPNYSKTPHLLEAFDRYEQEEIFKYNVGLGAITMFIKKALELRENDVQSRRAKLQVEKKNREKIMEENEKINGKLNEELQKHIGTLSGEEADTFNENQWKTEFYVKHPLHEVPPELQEEADNDM